MADRRRDPDYGSLVLYLRNDLLGKFRAIVGLRKSSNSEVAEEALEPWIEEQWANAHKTAVPTKASKKGK